METIYVVGPKATFDSRFEDFSNGTGWYFDHSFNNWGSIRHSLDGTLTLLEEYESQFDPSDLALAGVTIYTQAEITAYLKVNTLDWNPVDNF
tara:strand:+ start:106 stop:381 length:276 start_codon:yes stop_codon:yes gene_type:complete